MRQDENGNLVGQGTLDLPGLSTNQPSFAILLRKETAQPGWMRGTITPLDPESFDALLKAQTPTYFISDNNKKIEISISEMNPSDDIDIIWRPNAI